MRHETRHAKNVNRISCYIYFMTTASARITAAYTKLPGEIGEITARIREIIHKSGPELKETWKWGPGFELNGLAIGLWGFKKHVSLVFYRGSEMSDKHKLFNDGFDNAHNRMIKFSSLKEVNEKKLAVYIKEAVKLNTISVKTVAKSTRALEIPGELISWFTKNKKAKTFFDSLAFTYRKEYVQHITGAKQQSTRERRFIQVTESLKTGKKTIR